MPNIMYMIINAANFLGSTLYKFKFHFLGILVSLLVFNSIEQAMYRFIHMSFWVEYTNVAPATDYVIGEPLRLISYAEWKRTVPEVEWVDSIRCDCKNNHVTSCDSSGYYTFSTYGSEGANIRPRSGTTAWNYPNALPEHRTICYIRSTTTIKFPNGVSKQATIDGSKFNVIHSEGLTDFIEEGERFTFLDGVFLWQFLQDTDFTIQDINSTYGDKNTSFKQFLLTQKEDPNANR